MVQLHATSKEAKLSRAQVWMLEWLIGRRAKDIEAVNYAPKHQEVPQVHLAMQYASRVTNQKDYLALSRTFLNDNV